MLYSYTSDDLMKMAFNSILGDTLATTMSKSKETSTRSLLSRQIKNGNGRTISVGTTSMHKHYRLPKKDPLKNQIIGGFTCTSHAETLEESSISSSSGSSSSSAQSKSCDGESVDDADTQEILRRAGKRLRQERLREENVKLKKEISTLRWEAYQIHSLLQYTEACKLELVNHCNDLEQRIAEDVRDKIRIKHLRELNEKLVEKNADMEISYRKQIDFFAEQTANMETKHKKELEEKDKYIASLQEMLQKSSANRNIASEGGEEEESRDIINSQEEFDQHFPREVEEKGSALTRNIGLSALFNWHYNKHDEDDGQHEQQEEQRKAEKDGRESIDILECDNACTPRDVREEESVHLENNAPTASLFQQKSKNEKDAPQQTQLEKQVEVEEDHNDNDSLDCDEVCIPVGEQEKIKVFNESSGKEEDQDSVERLNCNSTISIRNVQNDSSMHEESDGASVSSLGCDEVCVPRCAQEEDDVHDETEEPAAAIPQEASKKNDDNCCSLERDDVPSPINVQEDSSLHKESDGASVSSLGCDEVCVPRYAQEEDDVHDETEEPAAAISQEASKKNDDNCGSLERDGVPSPINVQEDSSLHKESDEASSTNLKYGDKSIPRSAQEEDDVHDETEEPAAAISQEDKQKNELEDNILNTEGSDRLSRNVPLQVSESIKEDDQQQIGQDRDSISSLGCDGAFSRESQCDDSAYSKSYGLRTVVSQDEHTQGVEVEIKSTQKEDDSDEEEEGNEEQSKNNSEERSEKEILSSLEPEVFREIKMREARMYEIEAELQESQAALEAYRRANGLMAEFNQHNSIEDSYEEEHFDIDDDDDRSFRVKKEDEQFLDQLESLETNMNADLTALQSRITLLSNGEEDIDSISDYSGLS